MDHPSLQFIMRYPNGTIQLASQPHLANKRFTKCPNCPNSIIYSRGAESAECSNCRYKYIVKVEEDKVLVPCESCKGQMELVLLAGMVLLKCKDCGFVPEIDEGLM